MGVCGGVLLLLGLLLPWYPASGRYTFSAFTLLMNRQEGPLLLHAFLLIFGGFAFIGGGALARFLPLRDLTIVLLAGVVLSSIGVALSMVYLMAGFNLTNPLPGLYVFTCTSIRLEALLADMSHGFYVSLAGIAAGLAGCVLSAAGERVKTKSPRKN
ncbi:MAG: hypothetical protein QW567_04320 [Candidatus Hadarchaeales archaeon]